MFELHKNYQKNKFWLILFAPPFLIPFLIFGWPLGKTIVYNALGQPRILNGHNGLVSSITFSHDGKTLAMASDAMYGDNRSRVQVRLWDVQTGKLKHLLESDQYMADSLSFAPDDKVLAIVGDSGVQLWNTTGQLLCKLMKTGKDGAVAFSPDGKLLAVMSQNHTVYLWDITKRKLRWILPGHSSYSWKASIAFSPDGRTLAALGNITQTGINKPVGQRRIVGGAVQLIAVSTGQVRCKLVGEWATAIAFSPNGKLIASIHDTEVVPGAKGCGATVRVFSTKAGNMQRLWRCKEGGPFNGLTFSPNSKILASECFDHRVEMWDIYTGKLAGILKHFEVDKSYNRISTSTIAFSPDGKLLASRGDYEVRLWKLSQL